MRHTRFVRFFSTLNGSVIREIWQRSCQQRLPGLSAEIAFNAVVALFPAIVVLLTVVGLVGSSQQTLAMLSEQLVRYVPQEVRDILTAFVRELSPASSQQLLSISFVVAVWVASSVISATMSALDQIHQVPRQFIRPFWKAKLVSLVLTVGTVLLLMAASLTIFVSDFLVKLVVVKGDQIVETIANQPNFMEPWLLDLWARLSLPMSLGMVALAVAFLYRFGPSARIRGIPILPGAILATVFWALFSGIFRLYVANFGNYNRIYGTVGAIVVLLIWLQLGALTLLIGAQLNVTVGQQMHQKYGRGGNRPPLPPEHEANWLDQEQSPPQEKRYHLRSLANVAQYRQQNTRKNQHPKHATRHKS